MKSEEREHDFVATKLSKLTVSIKQGKLSSVLPQPLFIVDQSRIVNMLLHAFYGKGPPPP